MNKRFITITFIVAAVLLVGGGWFVVKTYGLWPQEETASVDQINQTDQDLSTSAWQTYSSVRGQFEFRLPRMLKVSSLFFTDQSCVDELGIKEVPLKVFEDDKGVLVHRQYDYLRNEQNKCIADEYTLAELRSVQETTWPLAGTWNIVSEPVRSEAELLSFIQKYFGSGCQVGEREEIDELTYKVGVQSDGKDLGESQCPINYWLAVRYSPDVQRAAAWAIGQDCNFISDAQYDGNLDTVVGDRKLWEEQRLEQCADFGMTASFRFKQ